MAETKPRRRITKSREKSSRNKSEHAALSSIQNLTDDSGNDELRLNNNFSNEKKRKKTTNKLLITRKEENVQRSTDHDRKSESLIDYVIVPMALIVIVAVIYWNALSCGLVFDDVSAITNNKDIRSTSPIWQLFRNDFWGTPMSREYSHKSYRPLTVLTFRLNYALTGSDPFYLHLTNIIIYIIVCFLFYTVSRKLMSLHASLVSTLIFTTHPIHTEAVTGVVGRAELLMSTFALLAFILYRRSSLPSDSYFIIKILSFTSCLVFVCASFFSKEQGLAIVLVLVTYELFILANNFKVSQILNMFNFKQLYQGLPTMRSISKTALGPLLRIVVMMSTGILIFFLRLFYVMEGQLPQFTRFDNPASYEDFPKRHLTFNYLLPLNLWLLIYPKDLLCDWSMGTIPLVESIQDTRNIATLTFYIILGISVYFAVTCNDISTRHVLTVGLSITVLTYLPASNIFIYVGFTIAERVLFMPSVGLCMIFGHVYSRYICERPTINQFDNKTNEEASPPNESSVYSLRSILSHSVLASIIVLFAYRTHIRNYDWHNDLTLFQSGLEVTRQNAKLYNNIGHVFEQNNQLETALDYYKQASDTQPDDIGSFINLGRVYYSLRQYSQAKKEFLKAKDLLPRAKSGQSYYTRIAPHHLDVYLHLASIEALEPNKYDTVVSLLTQVTKMRPDYTKAWLKLGKFFLDKGESAKAKATYESALKYIADQPDIYYNLGVVSYHDGKYDEALNYYEIALMIDPSHTVAKLTSSIVIQERNYTEHFPLAKQRLLSLIDHDSTSFGQARYVDINLPLDAIYYNLAMIAIEQHDDYVESEKWFNMTLSVKPNHRNALFNLALISNKNNQPEEALKYLHRLLKEHSDHLKGHLLKGHLLYSKGQYEKAKHSYERAKVLNPHSEEANFFLCHIYLKLDGPDTAKAKGCSVRSVSSETN